jgi:hypothetical protein
VSFDDYKANTTAADNLLKKSIADTMTDVEPSNIQDLNVTSTTVSSSVSRYLLQAQQSYLRSQATTSALKVTYKVVISDSTGSTNITAIYKQLVQAVNSGSFNTILSTYAAASGVTIFENATSTAIVVTNVQQGTTPTSDDSTSDDAVLPVGGIIGIAVGGFVLILLVALVVYYVLVKPNAKVDVVGYDSNHAGQPNQQVGIMVTNDNIQTLGS